MKAQAGKSRARHHGPRRRTQTAPLTRLLVADALRTWVIPTAAMTIGLIIFVVYNIGLMDDAPAVTIVGTLALIVVLFFGLRSFFEDTVGGRLGAVLGVFAVLWGFSAYYPFYRAINPGIPVFSTELRRDGTPVTIPLHDRPGHYNVVVEGHFLPAEGRVTRTATYRIAVSHGEATDHFIEGTFSQEWGSQRIGAGRRSSLVPVMHESRQKRDDLDDAEGRDVTMKLTDLSPGVRDSVTVRLYGAGIPQSLLLAFQALSLLAAVLIDGWRAKGKNEGLMATLTIATLVGLAVFRTASATAPSFPQLMIAALVGALAGAIGGAVVWRVARPLKRYLPALE